MRVKYNVTDEQKDNDDNADDQNDQHSAEEKENAAEKMEVISDGSDRISSSTPAEASTVISI